MIAAVAMVAGIMGRGGGSGGGNGYGTGGNNRGGVRVRLGQWGKGGGSCDG